VNSEGVDVQVSGVFFFSLERRTRAMADADLSEVAAEFSAAPQLLEKIIVICSKNRNKSNYLPLIATRTLARHFSLRAFV
jgi:hypothetical protein